jgi:hypothetical protein
MNSLLKHTLPLALGCLLFTSCGEGDVGAPGSEMDEPSREASSYDKQLPCAYFSRETCPTDITDRTYVCKKDTRTDRTCSSKMHCIFYGMDKDKCEANPSCYWDTSKNVSGASTLCFERNRPECEGWDQTKCNQYSACEWYEKKGPCLQTDRPECSSFKDQLSCRVDCKFVKEYYPFKTENKLIWKLKKACGNNYCVPVGHCEDRK